LLRPVVTVDEVRELSGAVAEVYVDRLLQEWIVDLVRATRESPGVAIGASVRGSLALERAVRAQALLDGRDYATPEDVERLFLPVLGHRVVFAPSVLAEARRIGWPATLDAFRDGCIRLAPPPQLHWDDEPEAGGAAA
jgi:MoxR-like ATPase